MRRLPALPLHPFCHHKTRLLLLLLLTPVT
jgi:hypothetical protein